MAYTGTMKSRLSATINKITRPAILGALARERLFHLLDGAGERPVTWVCGPGGSGKTTLAAGYLNSRKLPCIWYQVDEGDADISTFFYYMGLAAKQAAPRHKKPLPLLTPEYLQGIPTFTRRYFENLFNRLPKGCVVVLDNYQDSGSTAFDEMISVGLDVIPPGMRIIVLSRTSPPAQYARLRSRGMIRTLGWDQIRLTLEESREIACLQGSGQITDDTLARLHETTEGWTAGLLLMLEGMRRGEVDAGRGLKTREEIFDYFANEIFSRTDKQTREFLLKSAFLPSMTAAMAANLTGIAGAQEILSRLSRQHFFTDWRAGNEPVFQYHPLFREFLLTRAKMEIEPPVLFHCMKRAAQILSDSGQAEGAALLMREASDWEGMTALILRHAQTLVEHGRGKTLDEWISGMPDKIVRSTPWIMYWLGASRLPFDQIESRRYYQEAYRLFRKDGDITGCYLAWAGIADSFIYLWDDFSGIKPWLAELERLQVEHPQFPSVQVEARVILGACSSLYYVDSGNPMIDRWRSRIETLMREVPDPNFKCQAASNLMLHSLWYGAISDQRRIANYIFPFRDHPAATPFSRILVRHALACPEWMSGDTGSATALCEEGLRIADESGVHILDFFLLAYQVYAHGCWHADTAAMKPLLDRMRACLIPQRRLDVAHYNHIMGWYFSLCGRYDEALMHCEEATVAAKHSAAVSPLAFAMINTAQVMILTGRLDEAEPYLEAAREIIERHGCVLARYESSFVRSALALFRGREDDSLREVRNTLELAIKLGYHSYTYPHPRILQAICAYALQKGIESEYAASMVRQNCLTPPGDAPSDWPYPIKIHTLGGFEIRIDDKPLSFAGKVQKKPLEMLKVIIALGGKNIGEAQLTDVLWPDADGDVARKSFDTTLHRLRRLLGNDKAISVSEGRVTLDPRYCWVDVWAFERCCREAERYWAFEDSPAEARRKKVKSSNAAIRDVRFLAEKAAELYKGNFLAGEAVQGWNMHARERARARFVGLVMKMGKYLDETGQYEKAAEWFRKGLAVDGHVEEFYQQLMLFYQKQGQQAKAMSVYNACREMLASSLGVSPSSRTNAIYTAIKSQIPLPQSR